MEIVPASWDYRLVSSNQHNDITNILEDWAEASDADQHRVFEALHAELKRRAAQLVPAYQRDKLMLNPTSLVNEAYLKLVGTSNKEWQGRRHFLALAARVMRQIIVDTVRHEGAQKRGGNLITRLSTNNMAHDTVTQASVLDVDRALDELAGIDPVYVDIVEARVFAGLTISETAEVIGVSPATVKRKWKTAQVWLNEKLGPQQ